MYLMLGDPATALVGTSAGPAKKPDLTTSSNDISFSNPNPKEGDNVDISTIIRNVGKENASNVNVSFYVGNPSSGGVQIGTTQNVGDILVGQTKTAKVTWDTTGYDGNREIYVVCDSTNSINEVNENNNTASKPIYVHPKNDVGVIAIKPFKEGEEYALGKYDIKSDIKNFGWDSQQPFDVSCKIIKMIPINNVTVFEDDIEQGQGSWVEKNNGGSADDTWHIVTGYAHSQSHSWWCGPPLSNGGSGEKYSNNVNRVLITPKLNLSDAKTAVLTFWHKYGTEMNADYCYVEISTDGGTTWKTLKKWSGQCTSFVQATIFITAYAASAGNDNIKIRFRFESNSQNIDLGWYIDDVKIVKSKDVKESVIHSENKKTTAMNPNDFQTVIWNYDFAPNGESEYRVKIKTLLPNDSVKINDESSVNFTMLNMKPPPTILLKSPTGGEKWKGGSKQYIKWNIKDGNEPYEVTIRYSDDDGTNYQYIDKVNQPDAGEGLYEWSLPNINSDRVRIKVVVRESGAGRTSEYTSDRLLIDSSPPVVSVESPSAGVYWNSGKHTLNWSLTDNFEIKPKSVQISYSTDGGTSWHPITSNIAGSSYDWNIPDTINSKQCFIKVDAQDVVGNIGSDTSEMFTIDTTKPIIEHQPVKSWLTGISITISAIITDNFDVVVTQLNYKSVGSVSFVSADMVGTKTYFADIPAQSTSGTVEYYIYVEDKAENSAETQKFKIEIKDASQFGSISGRVKDATTGKPINGAKITASKNGEVVGSVSTTTKGTYVLAGLSPATYNVIAKKDGYDSVEVDVVVSAGKDTVQNFELYPEDAEVGIVKGIVVDKDGNPIKDATVHLDGKRTETNKNGEFIFRNVKPGEYTVKASKAGYEDGSKQVTVEPRKTEGVRITLYKKGEKPLEIPVWVYGTIAGVVAVLVILPIIAVILKRRKRPPYQYPPGRMVYGPPSYPQPPTQLPPPQPQPTQLQPSLTQQFTQDTKTCRRCGATNPQWALSCSRCKSGLG
jgi:protocatechuate 3,4-dioxygenase beta subunit